MYDPGATVAPITGVGDPVAAVFVVPKTRNRNRSLPQIASTTTPGGSNAVRRRRRTHAEIAISGLTETPLDEPQLIAYKRRRTKNEIIADALIAASSHTDPSTSRFVQLSPKIPCVATPVGSKAVRRRRRTRAEDDNGDGMLSFSEFSELVDAFGNQLAIGKDENGDG